MAKNENLKEILVNIGLTENESSVYLTALSLGSTTILKLSKQAGILRTTVYSVVNSLKNKGLMHEVTRGFKTLYEAEHPNKLESILEERKRNLHSFLPDFLSLYNLKGSDSTLKYYEGLEAVKSVYEQIQEELKPNDDYMVISDIDAFLDLDRKYFEKYVEKRSKQPINARAIVVDGETAQHMKKFEQNYNHQLKIISKDQKISVDLIITPYRLVMVNLENPISALNIENPSIVRMHKEIFEMLWGLL
jgi:HTH-type transcriptional regulator, sugar sensing transcriptional regulator